MNNGYDVLIDGTHTQEKSVKELLRIDKNAIFYLVDTPIEECQKRAIATKQEYLITKGVIERMDIQLKLWKHDAINIINRWRTEI